MGGLQPIDILILAIVCALSVLTIVFRVRGRSKARANIKKGAGGCGGGCDSCNMSSCPGYYRKDSSCDK